MHHRTRSFLFVITGLFFANLCLAQIGTKIPDARLPLVTSSPRVTEWQSAGYLKQLTGSIAYSLLINVRNLGAVGDGTTDDTNAFTTAISQANTESGLGGFTIVYVPAGTYKLTAGLSLCSNMVLKGDGANSSILYFCLSTGNYITIASKVKSAVEDLKLTNDGNNDTANYTGNYFSISSSHNIWVRGVESVSSPKNHINVVGDCYNVEVRENYIHDAQSYGGGGYGYGIDLDTGSNHCLFENNIFRHLRHSMVLQNDVRHNVFGYNASFDVNRTEIPNDYSGDIVFHGHWDANRSGPYYNLIEGNNNVFIHLDDSHAANGNYNTIFRNRADTIGLKIYSATNNQNMVNNYFKCGNWTYCNVLSAPWAVAGSGHFSANNCTYKVNFLGSWTTKWQPSQDNSYLNDYSYYRTAAPSFFSGYTWPYNPMNSNNPARIRNTGAVTFGFGGYTYIPRT